MWNGTSLTKSIFNTAPDKDPYRNLYRNLENLLWKRNNLNTHAGRYF